MFSYIIQRFVVVHALSSCSSIPIMPRKRKIDDDETVSTRFSFDLEELTRRSTTGTNSASSTGQLDQLFDRIVTSHAAPLGRVAFTERIPAPQSDPSASTSTSTVPGNDQNHLDADGPPDVDWDDYFGSADRGPSTSSESDEVVNEDFWDNNAREGFAGRFNLDDIEEREEEDVAAAREPGETVCDASSSAKVRCCFWSSAIF